MTPWNGNPYDSGKWYCTGCQTYRWPSETFKTLKGRLFCALCKGRIRKNPRKKVGYDLGESSPRIYTSTS